MKKDGKYRYSLQFDAITDEQIQVGELLEKLGNRKSAIIVPALFEYIKRHPEITEDHAKIKVQVEAVYGTFPSYSPYIAIPKVSSQNRRYIPMDYLEGEIIPGDKLFTMPSATSYEFGILMSNVHMAWTRAVCGRLKSDYSYSNMIVYNNFPWPSPTNDQKEKIRKTAQAILNARALYTDSNLADLYDPLTMPTELLKAHKANNRAVIYWSRCGYEPGK